MSMAPLYAIVGILLIILSMVLNLTQKEEDKNYTVIILVFLAGVLLGAWGLISMADESTQVSNTEQETTVVESPSWTPASPTPVQEDDVIIE